MNYLCFYLVRFFSDILSIQAQHIYEKKISKSFSIAF